MGGNGYIGWRLANAISFTEGGYYGQDYSGTQAEADAEVLREAQIHRQGALLGLQTAGVTPGNDWSWHVPIAGSLLPDKKDWIPELDKWPDWMPKDVPDEAKSYADVITGLGDDTQTILPPR